ncbi:hypothetical protein DUNSADRAFT_13983 [Dunaliella salina]|uniref:Uncharacterized protein n=1 Tax=Dunaliella salina TaxID=3046 RepID=A0ABQ7G884_DUNSA|nr:hypothetical protein DUNSADRAFT_13983 [Dunaliella salina]|eukprot:KAF5830813.1 hypothetical protein DUNSADRAFT_13983 [Dunaliella salina]
MAGPLVEMGHAVPFFTPAAAVLGATFMKAAKAAQLSQNCKNLVALLKEVDEQLQRADTSLVKEAQPPSVAGALHGLLEKIQQSGRLIQQYSQKGFMVRLVFSAGDESKFKQLDAGIHDSMLKLTFSMTAELLVKPWNGPPADYQPESIKLKKAVCEAADMPEENAEDALRYLSSQMPGKLEELVQQHSSFDVQIVRGEVQYMRTEMDSILKEVKEDLRRLEEEQHRLGQEQQRQRQEQQKQGQELRGVKVKQQEQESLLMILFEGKSRAADRQANPAMAKYLKEWKKQYFEKGTRAVDVEEFFYKLLRWFHDTGHTRDLDAYDKALEREVEKKCKVKLEVPSKKVYTEDGRVQKFLSLVVLPMVDKNGDDDVDDGELHSLQLQGEEFAQLSPQFEKLPESLDELLEAISLGYDPIAVVGRMQFHASASPHIEAVSRALEAEVSKEAIFQMQHLS